MNLQILELHYLGNTKQQPNHNERVAFGHDGQTWAFIFPESVLLSHFTGLSADPTAATTLYGVLQVAKDASPDDIRRAFRSAAKRWHSDSSLYVNSDPAFIRIKEAYDILSNPAKRARYDAGLALEASTKKQDTDTHPAGYRAPRRNGLVLVEGQPTERGQILVEKIVDWQPITNAAGQTLHASWGPGDKTYTETWLETAKPPKSRR